MDLPPAVKALITRTRRRWYAQRAIGRGVRALLTASAVLAAGLVAGDLFNAPPTARPALFALAAAIVVIGTVSAWAARADALTLARLADSRAGLKDALGTAVALVATADASPFARLTVRRADWTAGRLDPRRLVPLTPSRGVVAWFAALLTVSVAWLAVSPVERWRAAAGRGASAYVSPAALGRAADATKDIIRAAEDRKDLLVAAAARQLGQVAGQLERGALTPEEALAELAAVEGLIDRAGDATWPERVMDDLRRAGEALRGHDLTEEVGRRLQHGQTPEAQKALRRLAQQTRDSAGAEGSDRRAFDEAARRLQRAADAVRESAPDLSRRLGSAADQLDAGQAGKAAESLDLAAGDLDELQRRLSQLEQLKRIDLQVAGLKDEVRSRLPKDRDGRWALLMGDVPEQLRRVTLPSLATGGSGRGESGIGTADTGSGAGGRRTALEGQRSPSLVRGRPGEEGPGVQRVIRGAAVAGRSAVGYSDVFGDYAAQAEAALAGEQIPIGYRFYVRRYFEGIRPRQP